MKEEKDSVRKFGKWLSRGARVLTEQSHVFWTEYGPKTEQECEMIIEQTGNSVSIKRQIHFSILLVKGDSKFMQLITGTTMSTSDERCYQCSNKQSDWYQVTEMQEFCGTKFLENYFNVFSKAYGLSSQKQDGGKLVHPLSPIMLPDDADMRTVDYVMSRTGLWSCFFSVDPLHSVGG